MLLIAPPTVVAQLRTQTPTVTKGKETLQMLFSFNLQTTLHDNKAFYKSIKDLYSPFVLDACRTLTKDIQSNTATNLYSFGKKRVSP